MGRKKYVAYGSNLDTVQMTKRCPTAKVIGKGVIPDYQLLFRGNSYAYATIEPKPGEAVPVLIWEIGPEDERNLDFYEDYPRLYGKHDIRVQTGQETQSVMAYTMTDCYPIGVPVRGYLNTINRGYLAAGFDVEYLTASVEKCRSIRAGGNLSYSLIHR